MGDFAMSYTYTIVKVDYNQFTQSLYSYLILCGERGVCRGGFMPQTEELQLYFSLQTFLTNTSLPARKSALCPTDTRRQHENGNLPAKQGVVL